MWGPDQLGDARAVRVPVDEDHLALGAGELAGDLERLLGDREARRLARHHGAETWNRLGPRGEVLGDGRDRAEPDRPL